MGRMTKDHFGFSLPASRNSSLYTEHPYDYENVHRLQITYETDIAPVLDLLPEHIEPLTDPPQVVLTVTRVGFHAALGPYTESGVAVRARFKNESIRYVAFMWVNSDAAMAAGREIYGAPSKMGKVVLKWSRQNTEVLQGIVERPLGTRILTASVVLTRKGDLNEVLEEPTVMLKMIPDACGKKEPALAELLQIDSQDEMHKDQDGNLELYAGIGSVSYDTPVEHDPVHYLVPRKIISSIFQRMNIREEKATRLYKYF